MGNSRFLNARAGIVALLLTGLAAGGISHHVSAAAPAVVGIAAAIVNDVRIKSTAARQFAKAAVRQRVALADQVQTGGASKLQLLLLDRSKFTVGANARLTIDRFVYNPNGSAMSATVAKGALRFMSGRAGGGADRSITSPSATIGVRGTLLDVVVGGEAVAIARGEREVRDVDQHDPATATLVVLRGPGPRRQGNDAPGEVDVAAGGETVTLDNPLEAAYVPYAGARPIPFTISSPGVARLNDMLLQPREILYDPDAPGQPTMPQPERDRPYYDYPPPGGFGGDGPRPSGGGYGPGNIPGLNVLPTAPNRPERPTRPGRETQPMPNPGQTSTPPSDNRPTGTINTPEPTPTPTPTSTPQPSPTPTYSPQPQQTPVPSRTQSPNDDVIVR